MKAEVAEAWGEWVASMGEWHLFGGMTYDPARTWGSEMRSRLNKPHPEAVQKHVRGWLRESERRLGRPIEAAVVAVEAHKSGWPHCHPLLRLGGGLGPGDIATIGQTWYERRGYIRLEVPRTVADVCQYACKYLSKDLGRGDVFLWPQRGSLSIHQPQLNQPAGTGRRHA